MKYTFDGKKSLESCPPVLGRMVGVRVSEPYLNTSRGSLGGRLMVEVEKEVPTLSTTTIVTQVRAESWQPDARAMTRHTIGCIEMLITELQSHRRRLESSLNLIK